MIVSYTAVVGAGALAALCCAWRTAWRGDAAAGSVPEAGDAVTPGARHRRQEQLQSDLTAVLSGQAAALPVDFARALLREDGRPPPLAGQPLQTVALQRPFVAVLASQLCRLLQDGAWPAYPAVSNAELLELELDASEDHARWAALVLEQLRPQADADEPRRLPGVARVVSGLGTRGVSTLLGQRHTAGSVATALPPSREELQDAADALHRPDVRGSKLTVGGRALAKHIHRGSDSHWARAGAAAVSSGQPQPSGTLRGGDGVKSEMASGALRQLLDNACWANTHKLPGELRVHEVRNEAGYGARWAIDPSGSVAFRGFLEPQCKDGHEKKWRHDG